jgi:hypothetical protein
MYTSEIRKEPGATNMYTSEIRKEIGVANT